MLGKQRPLPRKGDHVADAAVHAHKQARRDEKAQHDAEKQLARNAAGQEDVTIGAGSTTKFYHSLGRPVRWRILSLRAAGTIAGPPYESTAAGTNDGKTITITNDNAVAVTFVLEVF